MASPAGGPRGSSGGPEDGLGSRRARGVASLRVDPEPKDLSEDTGLVSLKYPC